VDFVKNNILNEKRCIIVVTHDSRIFEYADRIMKMADGKIMGIAKGEDHEK
jgi:putative ABC transport system ATP-binding protein